MSIFKKRKLRIDILTIFLTLFISTVAGIVYYTYSLSNHAVLKVGNDLIEHNHEAIIQQLDAFLRPKPFVEISKYLLTDGTLNLSDMQALSSFMNIILTSYPELLNAYISDNKGDFFIENRYDASGPKKPFIPFIQNDNVPADTKFISQSINSNKNERLLTVVYKNQMGETLKTEKNIRVDFDSRTRPWFLGAMGSLNEPWLGTYQFYGSNDYGLTFAFTIPINKKVLGVAAADLNIDLITKQLQKFSNVSHGIVFIVNDREQIITQEHTLHPKLVTEALPTLTELGNHLVSTAYQIHRQSGKKSFTFTENHVSYIANFTHYAFSKNESWEIASIIPADTFVGIIKHANRYILLFSLIMLMIGSFFIILSSHKISKPIIRVAHATRDIIKLKFDRKIKIDTHIYEVQLMVDSLNATISALSSFAKYVPKVLVEQLLKEKIIAQVGGKKQPLTVLFTDIANFTEITERSDPEFLMIHISEYLNSLTQCIQTYHGNIDKYIGDAIMAFWDAPIVDSEHVFHACQAVLACKIETEKLNKKWKELKKPILSTRFGLHTGVTIVGNMGSADRLNYTAIGDVVNLASRLVDLNKVYGTSIIVSDSIFKVCKTKFLFRPIDSVRVRGKNEITMLYELVAGSREAGFPATEEQIELCGLFTQAYMKYQSENYHEAFLMFKNIFNKFPQDELTCIYIIRCEEKLKHES